MSKTLILVRHAHRYKPAAGTADNGLSPKGFKQAARLKKHFKKIYGKSAVLVVSSPKKRCVQSVLPIAGGDDAAVQRQPLLDEGGALELKSNTFMNWWRKEAPSLTVACSHGDLLPVLLETLTGARIDLKKGAWAELELDGGKIMLTWLIQEF